MSTERTPADKALWQSLATARPAASATVTDMDFAAWLEGGLTDAEASRIDAAVAADPALRQTALELADILGRPLPAAPPRIAARAQALVGFPAERPRRSWLANLLPDFSQGFALQRGALAAAAVMVATVGFMLGGSISQQFDEARYAAYQSTNGTSVARPFGRDTTGDLNDLFTDAT